jgi:hypothetical protein
MNDTIVPMRSAKSRYHHVLSHLYVIGERWHRVAPGLPPSPRQKARLSGCSDYHLQPRFPAGEDSFQSACEECRDYILSEHKNYMEPAYLHSVESARQIGRRKTVQYKGQPQEIYLGDNAVFTIVSCEDSPEGRQVITAFRVIPKRHKGQEPTEGEFLEAAVDKFNDKTSILTGGEK